jgi:hypothetical protein
LPESSENRAIPATLKLLARLEQEREKLTLRLTVYGFAT